MDINHKITWLCISYWTGAIGDFAIAILVLILENGRGSLLLSHGAYECGGIFLWMYVAFGR